jgi:uncharacterized protein (TIGR02147 family)
MQRPNIYNYQSYREFLKDSFEYLKKGSFKLSLRKVAKHLGVSVTLLSLILKGERQLGVGRTGQIAELLSLDEQEKSYFAQLIGFNDSSNRKVRDASFKRMSRHKKFKESSSSEVDMFKYLSKWQNVAIREMANLKDFKPEREWIQNRAAYKLYANEVDTSLKFLLNSGLIKEKEDGSYTAEEPLDCTKDVYKFSLGEFYKQVANLVPTAIDDYGPDQRHLLGHTVSVSKKNYQQIQTILEKALDEVRSLSHENDEDSDVYHMSFWALPLTTQKKED